METPRGYIDCSGSGIMQDRQAMVDMRREVSPSHLRSLQSDVLIITPDPVEVWCDRLLDIYLNAAPAEILASKLSRFECRVADCAENLEALTSLIAFIRSKVPHEPKIIVTVSPVPMSASFTGQDIAVAHTFSKATLRAVAQTVCDADPLIDYFPACEIVTLSETKAAWLPGHRHVQRGLVSHIVKTFKATYFV